MIATTTTKTTIKAIGTPEDAGSWNTCTGITASALALPTMAMFSILTELPPGNEDGSSGTTR